MAYHFIIIYSCYTLGYRIARHFSSQDKIDTEIVRSFMSRIEHESPSARISIHKLITESTSWESVVKKDSFFEGIDVQSEEDFLNSIRMDHQLTASNVARFIPSATRVTHLKLQKLLYYVYAEFLLKTSEALFNEPLVAYAYGPVVESVYHRYKNIRAKSYTKMIAKLYKEKMFQLTSYLRKFLLLSMGIRQWSVS